MNLSIKSICMIAGNEFKKWLFNPRIIILLAVMFPIYDNVIEPLNIASDNMNQPLNLLEPVIAVMNSWACMMTLTIVFIVLMSPFPSLKGNALFSIARMGKVNWVLGELLFQIISCIVYVMFIVVFIVVQYANKAFLANGWSLVASGYDDMFENVSQKIVGTVLPKNITNQMPPYEAFGMSVLLFLMLLIIVCVVLLLGCMYYKRLVFFSGLITYILVGSGMLLLNTKIKWLFLMAHVNLSQHYNQYFRRYIFSPYLSFYITIFITIISIGIVLLRLRKLNVDMVNYW